MTSVPDPGSSTSLRVESTHSRAGAATRACAESGILGLLLMPFHASNGLGQVLRAAEKDAESREHAE